MAVNVLTINKGSKG